MMLPIVTTAINTTTSVDAGDASSGLLAQDQLPQDFVQLLSQHLTKKTSSIAQQPGATGQVAGKDSKDKLLDALRADGIDLSQEDLNALLATLSQQGELDEKSLGELVGSLRKDLGKSTESENTKDALTTEVQALMVMLAQTQQPAQQNTSAQTLLQGTQPLSLSGLGVKTEDKEEGSTSALFSVLNASGATSSKTDVLSQSIASAKEARVTLANDARHTLKQNSDDTLAFDNAAAAASQLANTASNNDSAKLDLSASTTVPTHAAVTLPPAAQTSMTNNIAQPTASAQLNAQLGTAQWQDSLGQQIIMLSRNGQQTAQLRLHPEELGALHISLRLDDNQAQIHLASANSQVRSALEAALPHLRNAMAESGINLGQSSVGSDSSGWQQAQQQTASNNANDGGSSYKQQFTATAPYNGDAVDISAPTAVVSRTLNGVDIFA